MTLPSPPGSLAARVVIVAVLFVVPHNPANSADEPLLFNPDRVFAGVTAEPPLFVVVGDPTNDINSLRGVKLVQKGGVVQM